MTDNPSAADGIVTEEDLSAALIKITEAAERWQDELGTPAALSIQPGSELDADDQLLGGRFHLSTAFGMTMMSAVDHLAAMTTMIVRHQKLHIAAPWTLARGVLENAAAAYWLIHPDQRQERAARALRWWWQDNADRYRAEQSFHAPPDPAAKTPSAMTKIVKDAAVQKQIALPRDLRVTSTGMLDYAEANSTVRVKLAWQVGSGFAHGRTWAMIGALDRESHNSGQPNVDLYRLTNNLGPVVWVASAGYGLILATMKVYDRRRTGTGPNPRQSGLDAFLRPGH